MKRQLVDDDLDQQEDDWEEHGHHVGRVSPSCLGIPILWVIFIFIQAVLVRVFLR